MKFLGYILGLFLTLLIIVPLAVINGYVLSCMWFWFIVPLGVPALGTVHAIGIAIIVGHLTREFVPAMKNDPQLWEKVGYTLMRPFLALGIGYLVFTFM